MGHRIIYDHSHEHIQEKFKMSESVMDRKYFWEGELLHSLEII